MIRNLAVLAIVLALVFSPVAAQTIGGPVSGGGGGSGPPSGAAGGDLSGTYPNPTVVGSHIASGTISGLTAFSFSDATTYTTASTPIWSLTPTWAFSSTSNGVAVLNFNGTYKPTGASAGNGQWMTMNPSLNNSSANASAYRALNIGIGVGASYSGVLTTGIGILVNGASNSGTNPISNTIGMQITTTTNGNGATTGAITNTGIQIDAITAASGVGATAANTGAKITVPSGSSAQNTDRGLWITGNGGAASTKYALFSDSTAPSQLAGVLAITNATDAASSTGGALQVSGGASVAKRLWIPAISASAGLQTAVLCQSSGGEMIADSVACLASSARFKIIHGPMPYGALDKIAALPIERWSYKAEGIFKEGDWTRERIGAIAEDVASLDPRLVGYDGEGKPRSISTEQLLALTIKAVQELKTANDNLRSEVHRLEAGIR